MKTYLIKSNHTVTEDSYTEGRLNYCNGYDIEDTIKANNPDEAVKKYIENTLYFDFHSIKKDEFCGWYADFLVDADNSKASKQEIEKWKKGDYPLYNNYVNFEVYELNLINPTKPF